MGRNESTIEVYVVRQVVITVVYYIDSGIEPKIPCEEQNDNV